MSLDTYEMLRTVAAEIRSSSSSGKDALERAHKGAMFLLHEVHESKDIVYGDKATIANALRQYADTLDKKVK